MLFFGFTQCAHVCPIALQRLQNGLNQLQQAERNRARVLFFTVDPSYDSPPVLRQYLAKFSPEFKGVIAQQAVQDRVVKNLAAYTSGFGRNISHTEYLYFFDQSGKWIGFTEVPILADDLAGAIREGLGRIGLATIKS
jgi:protein SCO1/2